MDVTRQDSIDGALVAMAAPTARIVSLIVTQGSYYVDAATVRFDAKHPDIAADAADPAAPGTVFGVIVAALKARQRGALAPVTVMSCDNLPHNGRVARDAGSHARDD